MSSKPPIARTIVKNSAALAIGGVVAQIAMILVEVVLARGLGAESYGIFATTYAFSILAIFLFDLGTTWWTIQLGSREPARLPELLGNSLVLKSLSFLLLYVAVILVIHALPVPKEIREFVTIFALYSLGLAMVDTLAAVFTARQEMHINAVCQAASPVVILGLYLVLAQNGVGLVDAGIAFAAGSISIGVAWLIWTIRRIGIEFRIKESILMVRSSYHYAFTGILRQIFNKTDVVMIAFLAGAAEAGVYAAAVKFLDLFNKVPVLASRVISPALFAESSENITRRFELLVSGYSRLLVGLGAVASLITFLAADELILLVFGQQYSASSDVLRVLSLSMILKCMMTVGEGVMSSLDRHTQRWTSLAIAVVLNILLNFALIPGYGGVGAAVASIISGLALIVLHLVLGFGRERIGAATLWFGIPFAAIIAIGSAVDLAGLSVFVSVPTALLFLLLLLLGSGHLQRRELIQFASAVRGKSET